MAPIARAKSAVDVVKELATDGWRRTAADRLASYLGDELWTEVDRSWQTSHCERLARAARDLSELNKRLGTLGSVLAAQKVKAAIEHSDLARAMVGRALCAQTQADTMVRAIRVAGIILCVLHNCVESCQCLKDLTEEVGLPKLRAAITQICEGYLVSATGG
jgi:hypothetical protein